MTDKNSVIEAAKQILDRWDDFIESGGNYDQAYDRLAKYAKEDWEELRSSLKTLALTEEKNKNVPVLSMRDYFAIHANWDDVRHYSRDEDGYNISRVIARYRYADAMIEAR